MDKEIVEYLRRMAQTCIGLVRSCPHIETAHGLEMVAADLMAKALDIEKNLEQ